MQDLFRRGRSVLFADVEIVANWKPRSKSDLKGEDTSYVLTKMRKLGGWYENQIISLQIVLPFVLFLTKSFNALQNDGRMCGFLEWVDTDNPIIIDRWFSRSETRAEYLQRKEEYERWNRAQSSDWRSNPRGFLNGGNVRNVGAVIGPWLRYPMKQTLLEEDILFVQPLMMTLWYVYITNKLHAHLFKSQFTSSNVIFTCRKVIHGCVVSLNGLIG